MLPTEQIIIIVLALICLILIIFMIVKKDKKVDKPNGDVGNWSEKQKNIIYDKVLLAVLLPMKPESYIRRMCAENILDMMRCIVNKLCNTYSYNYANLKGMVIMSDHSQRDKMMEECSAVCLGQKGKWSDRVKSTVYSNLLNDPQKLGEKLASCIVNQLEKNYGPLDPQIISIASSSGQINILDYKKEMDLCQYAQQ